MVSKKAPSLKHTPGILNNSLESGGNGFHKMVLYTDLYSFHLLTVVLVGSTEDEDEEDPENPAGDAWMQLLDEENGVYFLKPLEEVNDMKANRESIVYACRVIMRQAWSEHYSIFNICLFNLFLVI